MSNHITIIPAGSFTDSTGPHNLTIHHMLDGEGEYTDDYEVLIDGKEQILSGVKMQHFYFGVSAYN